MNHIDRSGHCRTGAMPGTAATNDESAPPAARRTSTIIGLRLAALGVAALPGLAAAQYFDANSTDPAAQAVGTNSVAIGPNSVANGENSIAVGNRARSNGLSSIAIGAGALTERPNSVALGAGSEARDGARTGYEAYGMSGRYNSVGEVSVGSFDSKRQITNVAPGSQGTDAVNVDQLSSVANTLSGQINEGNTQINNRITRVEGDVVSIINGTDGMFQVNNTSNLPKPAASGADATAGGAGARAQGANSTTLGSGAQANADGSVALGAGSVADRANTVSVGAAGMERQISNVAAGTAPTDAVNLSQLQSGLNDAIGQANRYTDSRIEHVSREANAGTAAAMAIAGLPQAVFPGRSMASVSASGYRGEAALAIGVSTMAQGGRWVYRIGGTVNSRGSFGATVGAGFHW